MRKMSRLVGSARALAASFTRFHVTDALHVVKRPRRPLVRRAGHPASSLAEQAAIFEDLRERCRRLV
jgi:hypothetical protein